MRCYIAAITAVLVAVGCAISPETGAQTAPAQPASLVSEGAGFAKEEAELKKQKTALAAEDQRLKKEDTDLKAVVARLKASKQAFLVEANALKQDIAGYNAKCGGTHTKSVYESLRPTCDPWGARVDANNARLDREAKELTQQETAASNRQKALSEKTLAWAKRSKEVDAKISGLTGRMQAWRVKMLELKSQLPEVEKCAAIQGIETPMLNVLVAPAEKAHNCLARVWDGAKGQFDQNAAVVKPEFQATPRTPQQAIEDYKGSGAASPGPNTLRTNPVPPPAR